MTNGYIVLTKGEPNLYKNAVDAITLGKPIYYADGNKVAFVNSIELVSTDVVIKTSDKQITVASDGTETEEDSGIYRLNLYYSDTTFSAIVNTHGSFELNEEYLLCDGTTYSLSDELTASLIDVLSKNNVGNYKGIPFVLVTDETVDYANRTDNSNIVIMNKSDYSTVLEVLLSTKTVDTGNGEEWFIKFTRL